MSAVLRRAASRVVVPRLPAAALPLLLAACAASPDLKSAYAADFAELRGRGHARAERTAPDAPYDAEALALNFARVVHAHQRTKDDIRDAPLSRWEAPVRYTLFGEAMTPAERRHMTDLARTLSRVTGLSIAPAETREEANLYIMMFDGEERRIAREVFGDGDDPLRVAEALADMAASPGMLCIARTFVDPDDRADPNVITTAFVIIRAELPPDWRRSCFDEEVAQLLGPAYDHPEVRPSMFNDDEEFLFLTAHDEDILRLVYDPRLSPGMTRQQTAPLIREILADEGRPAGGAGG